MPYCARVSKAIELKYSAFGEVRELSGTMPTDYKYTGQREESEIGLYYYVPRFYDPYLNRFVQADSIVPNQTKPQAWDRFSYSYNNPILYVDPSGHVPCLDIFCENSNSYIVDTPKSPPICHGNICSDFSLPFSGDVVLDILQILVPCVTHSDEIADYAFTMMTLYLDYKETDGWWNADGNFTVSDFLAMSIYVEGYTMDLPGHSDYWRWLSRTTMHGTLYYGSITISRIAGSSTKHETYMNDWLLSVFNFTSNMEKMRTRNVNSIKKDPHLRHKWEYTTKMLPINQ